MTEAQQTFFDTIAPTVSQVSKQAGLLPSVVFAQAILESAWGTSKLATQGNNLFGIKADATWTGKTIVIQTNEYRNGVKVVEEKLFRAYDTVAANIANYGKFFTSTPWRTKNYQAFLAARDYQTAISALQNSGYATDPSYGEKLQSLITRYGLNRFD